MTQSAPEPATSQPDSICACQPVRAVVRINRVPIHALSPAEALDRMNEMVSCPATHVVNHIPADPLVIARRDAVFRHSLSRADLNLPDGMGVVWGARVLGVRHLRDRVYGPEFMLAVMKTGISDGLRHALVGGTPTALTLLAENLTEEIPGIEIVTAYSPPMRSVTRESVEEDLSHLRSEADVLWVGLGTPKQQIWAEFAKHLGAPGVIVTVGAAFDFLSGSKPQAPRWMRQMGLEWMHRLGAEPRRLWRRYLLGNPVFVWSVVQERFRLHSDRLEHED